MLNNNVNNPQQKTQMQFQALTPQQQEQLRQQIAMQANVNPELLKENVQDTYVANRVASTTDDPKGMMWTAGLTLPVWFAIAKGMDKYAEHCRGDYEKTIPGKIGAWGDRVADRLGKNKFTSSIGKGFKSVKTFCNEKIVKNSKILSAFCNTPSQAELPMVKDQMRGMLGFSATDWDQVAENFFRETHYADDLAAYGASADEIKNYKGKIGKLPKAQQAAELQKAEFELLKKYSRGNNSFLNGALPTDAAARAELLKNAKAYEFGLKDFKEFELIKKDRTNYIHRIIESTHNANKNMYSIAYEAKPTLMGKAKRFLFGRKVYGSEFANKMASSIGNETLTPEMAKVLKDTGLDKKIPKSSLGKFMAKINNVILEGATNRVAGGKLVAIMQAWFLAEAIYKSAKAEGGAGEKAKTFAERLVELVAMFACIPPALMLMHRIGGLQYAGMSKKDVQDYRDALAKHNEKAMKHQFANKAEWKASKKDLKKMLNKDVKNPITKLAKWVGRVVTVGLEQIRPYDKKDIGVMKNGVKVYRKGVIEKLKDLFRHPKFGIKQMAGYPMRIILGMMVIMPFFSKLAVKGCHAIVGRPKHSVLDEREEAAEDVKEQLSTSQQLQTPQAAQKPQQTLPNGRSYIPSSQGVQQLQNGKSQTNLLNGYQNNNASSTNTSSKSTEPLRNYVPSPVGVQVNQNEDTTDADRAMRMAELAEQQALQTLKMN